MTTWTCREPGCDASGEGGWTACDRGAERHTKDTNHPTTQRTVGATRVRDEGGKRDVRREREDE